MTMKTKESERLPLEMTEGKKKNYAGSFVGFMGARYDFLALAKDTNIDGYAK